MSTEPVESRRDRAGRAARHSGMWAAVAAVVVLLILIVVLIVENTRSVKVGWIVGYSHVSLIYLVLFAVVLGWLLGIATSIAFRRRLRRH
jgi:uncharacterized integral membrane protein